MASMCKRCQVQKHEKKNSGSARKLVRLQRKPSLVCGLTWMSSLCETLLVRIFVCTHRKCIRRLPDLEPQSYEFTPRRQPPPPDKIAHEDVTTLR